MAIINGTTGPDTLPDNANQSDTINALAGNDTISSSGGADTVFGAEGEDTLNFNFAAGSSVNADLGTGFDIVNANGAPGQVRLSFTSAQVGNGNINDSNSMPNQDGGLAVRFQAEDGADGLTGPVSRFDDEGTVFVAGTGVTFDIRDLVSGVQRGDQFEVAVLGTSTADTLTAVQAARPYYFNAGMGNDTVTGGASNDFLVGGAGDDTLIDDGGNDSFIGGGGNDIISGGAGIDTAIANVSTDGADSVNLGDGQDRVNIASAAAGQVRLTFTSAEVGNNAANDSNTMANQDGGLAVRLQSEDGADLLTGPVSRYDDEGITFASTTPGLTFDVRDLVSGVQRGGLFTTVNLGTSGGDVNDAGGFFFTPSAFGGTEGADYTNGGGGNDTLGGADGDDFLVGGAGDDNLNGGAGSDTFLGGAGNDVITSLDSPASIFAGAIAPQSDTVDAGMGDDSVVGGRLDVLDGGAGNDFLALNFDFNGPFTENPPAARPAVTLTLDANGAGIANDGTSIAGFESVNFNLTDNADTVNIGNVTASLAGNGGDDVLRTGSGNDQVSGGDGNDFILTGAGNDGIASGAGADTVFGGQGDDQLSFDPANDGADLIDLGTGSDTVSFNGQSPSQIRVTFTSADVGNGSALDGANAVNEDGSLAVRVQAEDANGNLIGPVSRFDDEGVTFLEGTQGYTFDVRDLPSGVARGDQFAGVVLGTNAADTLTFFPPFRAAQPFYYNAGQGNDTVTAGTGNDFLVGGAGDDNLDGGDGNDSFIGGGGNDIIAGGAGNDTATFNVSTDGVDSVNLGDGTDIVNVNAAGPSQVRLTFTSAQVGNGNANDSNTMANQDGGLAVRLQSEDGTGALAGNVSRFDDEGSVFVAGTGVTFDIRDLVSGVGRGDQFQVAVLGTNAADTLTAVQAARPYYFNAGMGNDTVTGGTANDFLVGGAGDDVLDGADGNDSFIGGGGNDIITGDAGNDTAIFNVSTDGADTVNLGEGADLVNVSAAAPGQVRLTFTSAEAGNGNANDGNAMTNQDGGLAVRLQAEDGTGALTGPVSRFDDENIIFASAAGTTFDVRDLVSGVGRGDQFRTAALGSSIGDFISFASDLFPVYVNAGMGNDTVTGGTQADFLVGGGGDDSLDGAAGNDSFIGGAGNDAILGGSGDDIIDGAAGTDQMAGGSGNDTYTVDAYFDLTIEQSGEGIDTVNASISRSLSANLENLNLTGVANLNGNGNELANAITGNAGNNALRGNDGNDTLTGGAGDDLLYGDDDADQMTGGLGNDTFYVDDFGDTTVEAAKEGIDTTIAFISHTLKANIETLRLNGGDLNGNGNALANAIFGTAGNNALRGNDGNDTLDGGAGDDLLYGDAGVDVMTGGVGNDTFYVDTFGEQTIEAAGQGTDSVISSISLTLGANIETLRLQGSANLLGNGNELANLVVGNSGNNAMRGYDGNDTLDGGAGSDILYGDAGTDLLTGGASRDTIYLGLDANQDTVRFGAVAESTGSLRDAVLQMDLDGEDRFDFAVVPVSIATAVTSGSLSEASFDADLAAAIGAAQLGAGQAVLFDPSAGSSNLSGQSYLVVDANGITGYQAGEDYVVQLIGATGTLTIDDFV